MGRSSEGLQRSGRSLRLQGHSERTCHHATIAPRACSTLRRFGRAVVFIGVAPRDARHPRVVPEDADDRIHDGEPLIPATESVVRVDDR